MLAFIRQKDFGRHYIRYLVSYLIVLMIPITILTVFYSSRFMKKFYAEIYETVDLELRQTSTRLDNEIDSMEKIVSQLTLTDVIHQAAAAENLLDLKPAIAYLATLSAANPFFEDIILVPAGGDYVATTATTCATDYFFSRMYPEAASFSEELIRTTPAPVLFFLPEQEKMFFSWPLYTDYQKYNGAVLFLVNQNSLRQLTSDKLQAYQAQTYILDDSGSVVMTMGGADVMRPALSGFFQSGQIPPSVSIGDTRYILRTSASYENGWLYCAFLPDSQTTFSQVSSIMRDYLLAMAIILFLSSLAIYFLQKANYDPIRRLRNKAKEISPEISSKNELSDISNALDYLSTENTVLSTKLESSLSAVKNERIYRLLRGSYADRTDFNMDCSELDLFLPNPCFTVAVLLLHTPVTDLDAFADDIKKQFERFPVYYYLHTFHPNQVIFLLNLPDQSFPTAKELQKLQTMLSKKKGLVCTIGTGSVIDSAEQIPQSYMEAASALDYRFVKGNGTIIDFSEIQTSQYSGIVYPHQEFEVLRSALASRSESNIRAAIQDIIRFMEDNSLPLYLARSICFDLIRLVNAQFRSQRNAGSSPIELSGMETAREIIEMLQNWSSQLAILPDPASKKVDMNEVAEYLKANCLRCDFSVYEAAEHFDMALPAFSKFYKEQTGQNVMDYTISLRIQKAKELLASSDLPLKEISEQVGYYNVSSFTRRFKLNQGVTPGEYRKIAAESRKEAP